MLALTILVFALLVKSFSKMIILLLRDDLILLILIVIHGLL